MEKDKRLMEASWWERLTLGKLGLVLMGWAMISKYLIKFSVDGWGYVPSLLFDPRQNYGGGNEDNGDFLQMVPCMHFHTQCPQPCSRPLLTHASTGDSWTLTGKSDQSLLGSLLLSPSSWFTQAFICAAKKSVSPVLWKFSNQIPMTSKIKFSGGSQAFCQIPRLGNLLWVLELS